MSPSDTNKKIEKQLSTSSFEDNKKIGQVMWPDLFLESNKQGMPYSWGKGQPPI